uniref:Uncharacterized protein n=1 Tax=Cannabis sativa TaxID=3483 RepID=A0A803Q645_CANSA
MKTNSRKYKEDASSSLWKWNNNKNSKEDPLLPISEFLNRTKRKADETLAGPGGGAGIGCGAGLGFGLVGGLGFGGWPWNHLKLVFGVGVGCGVGIGFGYGQGIGGSEWEMRLRGAEGVSGLGFRLRGAEGVSRSPWTSLTVMRRSAAVYLVWRGAEGVLGLGSELFG